MATQSNELIAPPVDRFCDLVMKGGITSGIVYPKAITELSKHYRFKNIGGTSAGAIAAAVTAAAEYQRRTKNSRDGFEKTLAKIPEELSDKLPTTGRSKLLSLFQPQPETRRLFSVLANALNCDNTNKRIWAIIKGFLKAYRTAPLPKIAIKILGTSLFLLIWIVSILYGSISYTPSTASIFSLVTLGIFSLTALIILFIGVWLYAVGVWVYKDVTQNVVNNGFGLSNGMTPEDSNCEALTPWLYKMIQEAAGLTESDDPLTFGMLWGAQGFPPDWLQPRPAKIRSINLQMFSTNLAHGRPYIFPVEEPEPAEQSVRYRGRDRLFFNPDELKPYLPEKILQWMIKHGRPYKLEANRENKDPDEKEAERKKLLEIPEPKYFPVLLATRMSLSFPFLLSAIPLWAINYDPKLKERTFCKCWFSDGGISSNFPIHLFDGLVPQWPTFGIHLEPEIKSRKITGDNNDGGVFLPKKYTQGYGERWNLFAKPETEAIAKPETETETETETNSARFGGFISAIISAMQSWNDNSLARMPGVRDRIVRVRLKDSEGGLNLDMPKDVIDEIVSRGERAVNELIEQFAAQPPSANQTAGWDEQRWVRLCTLLKMLEKRAPELIQAFSGSTAHATNFNTLIYNAMDFVNRNGVNEPPAGLENPLTKAQADAINKTLAALETLMNELNKLKALKVFSAIPEPELRVRPPL